MDMAPAPHSKLSWFFSALGLQYSLLLPLAALVAFILTLLLVIRGRGPLASAALMFAVSLPLLVGVYGFFDGMIAGFIIIAQSVVSPKPSEYAQGISTALVTPLVGMFLMAPSFLVALFGSFIRAMIHPRSGDR
jgi:hypothetical protein